MRKHSWRRPLPIMMLTIVVLLLSLGVGACSAGFNLSCGGEEGTTTYTDADYGYSFDYPAGWKLDKGMNVEVTSGVSAANSVSAVDPEGTRSGSSYLDLAEVSVYELTVTIDSAMMPAIKPQVEALLADLAKQDSSWKTLEALTDATVSGLPGLKTTVSYLMDSTPTTATLYFLFNGSIQYEIMLQAATEEWEAHRASFAAIVASFKPGSATAPASTTSR